MAINPDTAESCMFYYSTDGWTQDAEAETLVSILAGEETKLPDFQP